MKYSKFPRIYYQNNISESKIINFDAEDANYLTKVLRLKNGFDIRVFNENDGEYFAKLNLTTKAISAKIIKIFRKAHASDKKIYLFAPIVKAPKFEEICDKATQIGVNFIIPTNYERSQKVNLNFERINKIIHESARQCDRLDIPQLGNILNLSDVVFEKYDSVFMANEHENQEFKSHKPSGKIAFIVGPEGGLSGDEIEFLNKDAFSVSLGDNVLRSETAAIALMSKILL